MVVTPEGDYQLHTAKALAPGEAAELRAHGHRDSLKDYILWDRALFLIELIQRLLCSNAREAIIGSPAYA